MWGLPCAIVQAVSIALVLFCKRLLHFNKLCYHRLCSEFTTHLVCAYPSGSKYEAAISYNERVKQIPDNSQQNRRSVHIVNEEWLWQSIWQWQRQDESIYKVVKGDSEILHNEAIYTNSSVSTNFEITGSVPGDDSEGGSQCIIMNEQHESSTKLDTSERMKNELENDEKISSMKCHDASLINEGQRKYFLLSGGSSKKQSHAREILENMGGVVLSTQQGAYNPKCTHLLLWKLERTEKCICACAAGNVSSSSKYFLLSSLHASCSGFCILKNIYQNVDVLQNFHLMRLSLSGSTLLMK